MYTLLISIGGSNEWLLILAGLIIYILPSIVAGYRKSPDYAGIFLLNLLTGWTIIGWVGALLWAYATSPRSTTSNLNTN